MAVDLSNTLVTGVSSTALFDLRKESLIYDEQGLQAYKAYQIEHEEEPLNPGPAFSLIKALLKLNNLDPANERVVEAIIMSRNSAETSLRIFNSITEHKLDITRAVLTGGDPLAPYLSAFNISLFLSQNPEDVQNALAAGFPAAILYDLPDNPLEELDQIRIAFDGDAVLFSEESEAIFQRHGLDAFQKHEQEHADTPMEEGPFAKFLHALSSIQKKGNSNITIRTALVTARGGMANERVIKTLRSWDIEINEAFFLGGISKGEILRAFRPQIFFDDHEGHCKDAAKYVPTGQVPNTVRKAKP